MPLVRLKSKFQVVIPGAVRKKIKMEIGDTLEVEEKDGTVILKPVMVIEKAQNYFWTKEWQEGEKEAEAAKRGKKYKDFGKSDEAVKWLKS
jgi:antitoxin MazE